MSLCQECPQKSLCSTLCPEAEVYAKQDHIPQTEINIGIRIRHGQWPDIRRPRKKLSSQEKKFVSLLADGKKLKDIAQALNISYKTVTVMSTRIRKKL